MKFDILLLPPKTHHYLLLLPFLCLNDTYIFQINEIYASSAIKV